MPLHVAAATDDVRLARALVASGVDVEARNGAGKTALEVAAAADAAGVIHVLVANGVDLQILDRSLRHRPLHLAARANASNAVSVLLGHGASSDVLNERGETPLHAAAGADAGFRCPSCWRTAPIPWRRTLTAGPRWRWPGSGPHRLPRPCWPRGRDGRLREVPVDDVALEQRLTVE